MNQDERFDVPVPRRGTGSHKWDGAKDTDLLPMWVADMDFRAAPPILAALQRRVEHGVFGYTKVRDAYYEALIQWRTHRHGAPIERDWVLCTSGVVPAISAILRAMTEPGDRVILQPPVYNCFFSSIRNLGCEVSESPLRYHAGRYEMDFEDLERRAQDGKARVFLLCSPHNPVGRVWTREELTRVGEICFRNNILVVSDEIHCDLVLPGYRHTPFASLGPDFVAGSVTCTSPSKAFNLAGLQIANIAVADPESRKRIDRALNIHEVCDVNPFGVEALIAAYNESEAWLEALLRYVENNRQLLVGVIHEELPRLLVVPQEATYLSWIDCRQLGLPSSALDQRLRERGKLWVNNGTLYGAAGEGFIRLNLACPKAILQEGLARLCKALH